MSVFLNLLKRYLSLDETKDASGREYEKLNKKVELLAYCLMPNHFHLLLYLINDDGVSDLMKRVTGAYTVYYNKKNDRVGGLFQGVFKASRITSEPYLWHISRYIHLNPIDTKADYRQYQFSSYQEYVGLRDTPWVSKEKILSMHNENNNNYEEFVADYVDYKKHMKTEGVDIA